MQPEMGTKRAEFSFTLSEYLYERRIFGKLKNKYTAELNFLILFHIQFLDFFSQ